MQTIKDFLNKIKWDDKIKKEDYAIHYLDNITKKLEPVKFIDIKRLEGTFIVLDRDGEETYIPMHRIREVREKAKPVWKRH